MRVVIELDSGKSLEFENEVTRVLVEYSDQLVTVSNVWETEEDMEEDLEEWEDDDPDPDEGIPAPEFAELRVVRAS